MRTQLKHGKIPIPESVDSALTRRGLLLDEVRSIEEQLADPGRAAGRTNDEYDQWCQRARTARNLFQEEAAQLAAWIDRERERFQVEGLHLLARAWSLLARLELKVDFQPGERALMERLDRYFARPTGRNFASPAPALRGRRRRRAAAGEDRLKVESEIMTQNQKESAIGREVRGGDSHRPRSTQERINEESDVQLEAATATGAPLAELSVAASVLARSLFLCEALPCTEGQKVGVSRCLDKESHRLKGYPQLPPHSTNRARSYFDPQKLCNHCRPYWYAEMASVEMRWCGRFEAEVEAERQRDKPPCHDGRGCCGCAGDCDKSAPCPRAGNCNCRSAA